MIASLAVVRWIDPADVGEWLLGLGLGSATLFALALIVGTYWPDAGGFLARLSLMCLIPFVTLALSSL